MKGNFRLAVFGCLALVAGLTGCSKPGGDKKVVADVAQDTMLLHDLAEANRNTASGEPDTTMAIVQRGGAGPGALTSGTVNAGSGQVTPSAENPRPVSRIPAPTRASDASAPMTVPRTRPKSSPAVSSSGDLCDSPAMTDQRSCLNRAIAGNDAELNRIYQDLIRQSRASGGAELEERFRQSQRNWIDRRDVECRQQNNVSEGRLWARGMARCLGDYSDRRVPELRRSLNQLRGQ